MTTTTTTTTLIGATLIAAVLAALLLKRWRKTRPRTSLDRSSARRRKKTQLNFLLYALGTRGDVQPVLAVAREILSRAHGHRVWICASDDFRDFVEREPGCRFVSCGIPTMRNQDSSWLKSRSQSEFLAALAKTFIPQYSHLCSTLLAACEENDVDVVVTGLYGIHMALDVRDVLIARAAAKEMRRAEKKMPQGNADDERSVPSPMRVWAIKYFPDSPTRVRPPFGSDTEAGGRGYNWLTTIAARFGWINLARHYAKLISAVVAANRYDFTRKQNEFRASQGIPKVTLERLETSGKYLPTVFAYSPTLLPKPHDWPPNFFISGFLFYSSPRPPLSSNGVSHTGLDGELEAFLTKHANRVVCVTFGSMSCLREAKCDVVVRSCRAVLSLGFSVVLISAWNGGISGDVEEDITRLIRESSSSSSSSSSVSPNTSYPPAMMVVESAPHELLFPRVCAVVHHGGAGTTSRALGCGMPSVIVPVLRWLDQSGYAELCAEAGVGVHVRTPYAEESELRAALERVLCSERAAFAERARVLGAQIAAEGDRAAAAMVDFLFTPLRDAYDQEPRWTIGPAEDRMFERSDLAEIWEPSPGVAIVTY